jgi:hypothetical protein
MVSKEFHRNFRGPSEPKLRFNYKITSFPGQAESAVELDLARARDDLLKELRITSVRTPVEKSLEEWIGEASRHIESNYERRMGNYYSSHKLAVINGIDNKIWTFWNSIVFCGTVYTSIGEVIYFGDFCSLAKNLIYREIPHD